jgi:hypothetical protein
MTYREPIGHELGAEWPQGHAIGMLETGNPTRKGGTELSFAYEE